MNKKSIIRLCIDFILLIILIVLDQITKNIAVFYLKDKPAIPIINNILQFNYLENRGAAFGMLQDQKWFFLFVGIIILGVIAYILTKTPTDKKYIKLHMLLTFIAAGAIGNMIDRLSLNYVVDFIYFKLIDFPIFNVADIYVTCATFLLIVVLLFVYKEKDLMFLNFRSGKYRTLEESKQASKEDNTDSDKEDESEKEDDSEKESNPDNDTAKEDADSQE